MAAHTHSFRNICILFVLITGLSVLTTHISAESDKEISAQARVIHQWPNSNVLGSVNRDDYENISLKKLIREDFYTAANFDWLCDTEITDGSRSIDSFYEVENFTDSEMQELLQEHKLEGIVQEYYDLLNDSEKRKETWPSSLVPHLEILQGIETLDDLKTYLTSEEAIAYGNSFTTFEVLEEGYHEYCMYVNPCNLFSWTAGVPDANTRSKNDLFCQTMHLALPQFGYSEEDCDHLIANVFAFEKDIAKSIFSSAEKNDPDIYSTRMYSEYTLDKLKGEITQFPLADMIEAFDYDRFDTYFISEPEWLNHLNRVFTERNVPALRDYLIAGMIFHYITDSDPDTYQQYLQAKYDTFHLKGDPSFENAIYDKVKSHYTTFLANAYIDNFMTPEIKEDVSSLTYEIIDSYEELLSNVEWMSPEAKEMACKKLRNMKVYIAYEDDYESPLVSLPSDEVDMDLISLEADNYIYYHESVLNTLNQTDTAAPSPEEEQLAGLSNQINMYEANAQYFTNNNAFVIPAGILAEPIYSIDMTREEKLGKLGSIIAHEISHAFDPYGALFDEYGNPNDWWTEEDKAYYSRQVAKLVSYMNQLVVLPDKTRCPGSQVKDEMIADILSMQCLIHMANKNIAFDYDTLFRSYAALHRSKSTLDYEHALLSNDTHPLDFLRVNITVSQFPEFIETYKIQSGDGMFHPAPAFQFWDTLSVLDHYKKRMEPYGLASVTLPDTRPEIGENFYFYIVYEMLSKMVIPKGIDAMNMRSIFTDSTDIGTSNYVYSIISSASPSEFSSGSLEEKIWNLYQSGMDTEARAAAGWGPVQDWFTEIDDWKTIEDFYDFLPTIYQYDIHPLLLCQMMTDTSNNGALTLTLQCPIFYASPQSWINPKSATPEIYRKRMKPELESTGYSSQQADQILDIVIPMIVNSFSLAYPQQQPAAATPLEYYSLEEQEEAFPNLNIRSYLEMNGLDGIDTVATHQKEYLSYLNNLLRDENLDIIRFYTKVRILEELLNYGPVFDSAHKYEDRILNQVKDMYAPNIREAYIRQTATEEAQTYVKTMAEDIIQIYKDMIDQQTWLSSETKDRLKSKLGSVSINVLVPDLDSATYDFPPVPASEESSWLKNYLNYKASVTRRSRNNMLSAYREKRMLSDSVISSLYMTDTSYNAASNRLTIPAIQLQEPFYGGVKSDFLNLATLGIPIATQLAKVFNPTFLVNESGEQYISDLKESEMNEYLQKAKKVADHYSEYEIAPDQHLDGEKTLNTHIQDLTAMECIVRLAKERECNMKVFFYEYAFTHYESYSEDGFDLMLKNPTFTPASIGVNAVLRSTDDFYEAYDITENDPMYLAPQQRLHLWD